MHTTKFLLFLFFSIISIFNLGCSASKQSNMGVELFEGISLEGKIVSLAQLNQFLTIAINVYSPTCVPCVKEIPTLNYIYSEIQKSKKGEFFLVVDPSTLIEDPEKKSAEVLEKEAIQIMKQEISKRNIQLPVIVMKKPFRVEPKSGLITGTPETLLFRTNPLTLFYNFIGPISEKQEASEIQKDSKVNFFLKMFGGF